MSAQPGGEAAAEVLEERTTESSITFQNPDGSLTTELDSGPVRFQDDGEWVDIDTTLVKRGGAWVPKAAPLDISFPDGTDAAGEAFVDLKRDGGDAVALGWPTKLPEPTVDGATLTYKGAVPGGDLVVTALAGGFTHSVVLNERPEAGERVQIPIPVDLHGTKVTEAADGTLKLASGSDEPLRAPAPVMWDSSSAAGDGENAEEVLPERVEPVATSVTQTGPGDADATVTLTPDQDFLSDPKTVYPVTIDPTFTEPSPSGDTFVQNAGSYTSGSTVQGWDTLRVGTQDAGAHYARSFVRFSQLDLTGIKLTSAQLQARVVRSLSCTNGTAVAERITGSWDFPSLTWTSQPAVDSSSLPQYWLPHGGPTGTSCAAHGWATWNVLPAVTKWQQGEPQRGFRLRAATETANGSYRELRSVNATPADTTYHSKLVVTYNTYPETPTNLAITPSSSGVARSTVPTISAFVKDVDAGTANVRAKFRIYTGGQLIWSGEGSSVSTPLAGGTSSVQVPEGVLEEGRTYTVTAHAYDGTSLSGTDGKIGGYASTVVTVEGPIAFGGRVANATSLAGAKINVKILPNAATADTVAVGEVLPTFELPDTAVRREGNTYFVGVLPESIPPAYVDPNGIVTFSVDVELGTSFGHQAVGVRRVTDVVPGSSTVWANVFAEEFEPDHASVGDDTSAAEAEAPADPDADDADALEADEPSTAAPVTTRAAIGSSPRISHPSVEGMGIETEVVPDVADVELHDVQEVRPGGESLNTFAAAAPVRCNETLSTPRGSATIGTTYPVGGTKAWITWSTSDQTKAGFKANWGDRRGWFEEGRRPVRHTDNVSFRNVPGGTHPRSYRTYITYREYWTCVGARGYRALMPQKAAGSDHRILTGNTPKWSNCVPYSHGSRFSRRLEKGEPGDRVGGSYKFAVGVRIPQLAGATITASVERKYTQSMNMIYDIAVSGKQHELCGNDDVPGAAGKVRERLAGQP
ncbi:DNRLRE domain-containing protein [Marmoricola sp. RAF53]|uniref:DNRLRE domain-containing protein n=1 Tax=Marmoricola sp. RAF53 TaxID=3233059 RepID=UPI003F9A1385